MPGAFLPEGILTREKQLERALKKVYNRISFQEVKFRDRPARRLEYLLHSSKTVEWEIEDGDAYLIFQLTAPQSVWEDDAGCEMLHRIRDSFVFTGATLKAGNKIEAATAEQIRAARQNLIATRDPDFELRHHQLRIDLEPTKHSLHVHDKITLCALTEDVTRVTLFVSEVSVQEVTSAVELDWEVDPDGSGEVEDAEVVELRLTFAKPLPREEDIAVDIVAHSKDFLQEIDQELIVEIAVLGQVREQSSFSSHINYYPVDERKTGSMDMTLSVPTGMTAVTGGELISHENEGSRDIFQYQTVDRRPRLLPFGFAAAEYVQRTGRTAGGLQLTFYGYPGEEKLLEQRVTAGVDAGSVFERLMGPLPWNHVRFAHVTPDRKETGVSLPGLILISDQFFTDIEDVDISEGNLADPDTLSLLAVADELSHQWNAYAVPLPNQLAEGVSTFTNVLFIEKCAGHQAYDNALRFCRKGYFMSCGLGHDVAIADPAIYQTAAYRGIAFTKTAVVLAMLRELVGDDLFFAGWRAAFQEFDAGQDGFQVVEDAFSRTANQDLKWFFDQWFYRPGWVKLAIFHEQQGNRVSVRLDQRQAGDPFRMPIHLVARAADGKTHKFDAQLQSMTTTVEVDCPFVVQAVVIDPDEIALVEGVTQ